MNPFLFLLEKQKQKKLLMLTNLSAEILLNFWAFSSFFFFNQKWALIKETG